MKKSKIILRPATQKDVDSFYAEHGGNSGYSLRAIVAELDGRILGLAGTYMQRDGKTIAFSQFIDEMAKYKKDIVRATYMVMRAINAKGMDVYAVCQSPKAIEFCKRLGFEEHDLVEKGKVMKWQQLSHTY